MRSSRSQAGWLGSPSALSYRPGSGSGGGGGSTTRRPASTAASYGGGTTRRGAGANAAAQPQQQPAPGGWGPEYYLRLPCTSIDAPLTEEAEDALDDEAQSLGLPSALGSGDGGSGGAGGALRKRIPLPFLDPCSLPVWKSAPRRERDEYWARIQGELFSIQDDRFLVMQCLFPPNALMDSRFLSEFVSHKRALYKLPQPPANEGNGGGSGDGELDAHTHARSAKGELFLVTQLENPSLPALQHRLRALATLPTLRTRLNLLQMDVECSRADAARVRARQVAEERRLRREEAAAARGKKSRQRSASPTSAKGSKVAARLAGALEDAAQENDDSSPERSPSPSRPTAPSALSDPDRAAAAETLAALEAALTERASARDAASAASEGEHAPPPPLPTEWLERVLNLVVIRAGHISQVDASLRRFKKMVKKSASKASQLSSFAQATPGAEFLPPPLAFLANHAGSFFCVQGILRDMVRVSERIKMALRRGEGHEHLHPSTGQTMISILIREDDPVWHAATQLTDEPPSPLLPRVMNHMAPPVLGCFVSYTRDPHTWRMEKAAREKLNDMQRLQKENEKLLLDLDSERCNKLDALRELHSVHKLRIISELERELEERIAALRRDHLARVAVELTKIQSEIAHMEKELDGFYANERQELKAIQSRVQGEKTRRLRDELDRSIAVRQRVFDPPLVSKLCLLAQELHAHELFDDCMEIASFHLPHFQSEIEFLSPLLPRGAHRLLFAHASLADLSVVANERGISTQRIERAIARAMGSNAIVEREEGDDDGDDEGAEGPGNAGGVKTVSIAQGKSSSRHISTLQALYRAADLRDVPVHELLANLASRIARGERIPEQDLTALESELQMLLEFRLASSSGIGKGGQMPSSPSHGLVNTSAATGGLNAALAEDSSPEVLHTRLLFVLLTECAVRRYVTEEIKHRVTMINQVLLHPVASPEKQASDAVLELMTNNNADEFKPPVREETHSMQEIIAQITKAYKGQPGVSSVDVLARQNVRKPSTPPSAAGESKEAEKEEKSQHPDGGSSSSSRNPLARALFRELGRRVIASFRSVVGWVESDNERPVHMGIDGSSPARGRGVPACLHLSHHARRITVTRPFRYGTLHCNVAFPRLDPSLPLGERAKHKWMFEVRIGRMDEGAAQVMIGFDIEPPQKGSRESNDPAWGGEQGGAQAASSMVDDGLPTTLRLKSLAVLAQEHTAQLESFHRTQLDRFSRALPMLAAASMTAGVPTSGNGAAEALAKHIGNMLHAANERAAAAQAQVQLQIVEAMEMQPSNSITAAQTRAAMAYASNHAATAALRFTPPAHLATHPAFSSTSELTEALLQQVTHCYDPLASTPFQMFPTAAFQLPSLCAPPPSRLTQRASGVLWQSDGIIYAHGASFQCGVGFGEGDVVGAALDLDSQQILFVKNGQVFVASPNESLLDLPHTALQQGLGAAFHPGGGSDPNGENARAGNVIGRQLHGVDRREVKPRATDGAEEVDDQQEAEDDAAESAPGKIVIPGLKIPRSLAGGGGGNGKATSKKKKKQHQQQQEKLLQAIAASAAAGTEVSLLDTPSDSPRSASAAPGMSASDPLSILRTPLHPTVGATGAEIGALERIEKGNIELQRRLALTTGAAPIELAPVPAASIPPPLPAVLVPPSPTAAATVPAIPTSGPASGFLGSLRSGVGALSIDSPSSPLSPLGSPSSALSPTNANAAAAARLAKNLARSGSAGSLAPLATGGAPAALVSPGGRRRERGAAVFGSAGSSAAAALVQAQQVALEAAVASVAVIQTAAAEALANAQQVYAHNQAKSALLNAAIAAQTLPANPVFADLQRERARLLEEAQGRGEGSAVYADLDAAAGLPRFHSHPHPLHARRRRRARTLKRREKQDTDGVIDLTTDDGGASGADDASDDEPLDDGSDRTSLVDGWRAGLDPLVADSVVAARPNASTRLARDNALMPSTLAARSFHDAPPSFQRRFGVQILLPSPRMHLPTLLSTQQLAQVFAAGVSVLASSDSMDRALDSVLHHTNHLLLLNQSLVRTALAQAVERAQRAERAGDGGGDGEEEGAGEHRTPPPTTTNLELMNLAVSSTGLIQSQPIVPPTARAMRGIDVAGSPISPTASRAHQQRSTVSGAAAAGASRDAASIAAAAASAQQNPLRHLARVVTAARNKEVVDSSAPYTLDPSALGGRLSTHGGLGAQERQRNADDTLVQGRAHYTLRPCVVMYSSKPMPSNREAEHLSASSRARDSGSSGPRAFVSVNFEGNFLFPLTNFRPVKNAH